AWNCEPVRFEAQTSLIPALASMKPEELEKFEIDGTTLRWPKHDVDISVETIRYASEPTFRAQQDAAARRDANRYAAAMKRVRRARGLKQRDFDGLSERQVRRLENGDSVPHADTLRLLASAFGISVNEYMLELAEANE
ncbi:MAG TPA: helix-turn-helix domain-containing protein, partial [Polyangiaceae bacterium]|nr:helix-turn-helix domain-containing protein [Polyangiaceae bacterium]